ncbi:MmgE/PrpD family protein [Caballeronia sp. GAWG1-1]|uniref:MmgE/PrpD family protein n=1 Tax=Caballeronia sp. GAWG1-1 TaxID=2921742 RepID=UPI002028487E|nr:MmgE/PrpD family protein [Caballeronia sp. GAWG1-1]
MSVSAVQHRDTHEGFAGLVDWLIAHRIDAIPADAIHAGKQCMLDGMACFKARLHTVQMESFARVLATHSNGHASLFDTVQLYAHAANILDFDDCFRGEAPSHPGATIVGPALACAHRLQRGGMDLLHAVIVAYEASLRIGAMLCPSDDAPSKDIGYASWRIFGAYIAAGMLLGLTREQWMQGFGLAAQQAPMPMILRANPGGGYTWLKNGYGAAASAGVMSAYLAKEGFIGDQHFFSDTFGFRHTYGSDRIRPALLRSMPGDDWWIRRVEFKPWACCRWSHPAIEAVLEMKPSLDVNAIAHIDIHSFRKFVDTLDSPFPTNLVDAQFNVRFLVASAWLADDINAALREPDFESTAIRALFGKIDVHHEADFDLQHRADLSIPTRVVVTLNDGTKRCTLLTEPPGSIRRDAVRMEHTETKFRATLMPLLGTQATSKAFDIVMHPEAHGASDLMDALCLAP